MYASLQASMPKSAAKVDIFPDQTKQIAEFLCENS
jgi:hypothetical protein